ncbi:hypothetical protein PM082_015863 [Marasmius tenuissimus]|nr:hypothetical protein PM082_015863 [Marasmius tenuissimus]
MSGINRRVPKVDIQYCQRMACDGPAVFTSGPPIMAENVNHGRDQNVHLGRGDINVQNVAGDFVQNHFTTTDSHTHLRRLYDAVAGVGASHTSKQQFARGKCLRGTREEALGDIHEWRVSCDPSRPICWLSGTAGVGKTAIAMTIAEACEEDGLVASFFFFRSDSRRNNPDALMPTIAVGLVSKIPSLRTFVDQQISRNPTLLDADLEHQFRELVVKPSLQMERSGIELGSAQKVPNLVIIDGLDECGDEDTQKHVLSTILSPYQQLPGSTVPSLKFLICSRPEAWIREAFDEDLGRLTKHIALNNAFQTDRDIKRYYMHEFEAIRTSPKFARLRFPSPWPSYTDLGRLVQKSSRQFVYAATAVKFVTTPYSNPLDQLRAILDYDPENERSDSPFPELDRLYHIILSLNPNREKLLPVLAAIFIGPPYPSPSPEVIEFLLCLTPGEVDLTLRAMYSILWIGGGWDEIKVFHTSFSEFVQDRSRSGIFYFDRPVQTHFLARRWLQALSAEKLRRYSCRQLFEDRRQPLFTQWIRLCTGLSQPSRELLADLQNVDLNPVLLCHEGLTLKRVFGGLVWWLNKSNACDLHPTIIEHFKNRPKCFHLEPFSDGDQYESEQDPAEFDDVEYAVILKINSHRDCNPWRLKQLLKDPRRPFTLRVTDCHCNSEADLASSYRSHRRYEAACLRAVKILVSKTESYPVDARPPQFMEFVDSPLLRDCAPGVELFAQCWKFCSLVDPLSTCRHSNISIVGIETRRKKLLDWLEMCPQQYAIEAENLKRHIRSLFDNSIGGQSPFSSGPNGVESGET